MNHIIIPPDIEPECLKSLRSDPVHTYNDLKGDCKYQVVEQLSGLQNELCAYCERKLTGFIEHYLSINTHPDKQLDWDNFLAVCSGRLWTTNEVCCSQSKDNTILSLDPRKRECIDSIYFEGEFIRSKDMKWDGELNNILGLNCSSLINKRLARLKELEYTFLDDAIGNNLSELEFNQKLLRNVKNDFPEFYSYLIFSIESRIQTLKS